MKKAATTAKRPSSSRPGTAASATSVYDSLPPEAKLLHLRNALDRATELRSPKQAVAWAVEMTALVALIRGELSLPYVKQVEAMHFSSIDFHCR